MATQVATVLAAPVLWLPAEHCNYSDVNTAGVVESSRFYHIF